MNRRRFLKNSGWSMLGIAASGTLLSACSKSGVNGKPFSKRASDYKVFWGDLHNHCNLTYGHGDMRSAFEAAKQQLDFVAVTPHALWPDIPGEDDPRLAWVIGYHTGAFKRLREEGYEKYLKMTQEYNKEGEFLTFVSYEAHSMEEGDHVVLNYDLDAPLLETTSVADLKEQLKDKKAFITPHHLGYQLGYRGYNWKTFNQEQVPFVEIFSRHGLSESDQGDYNYLHDMGPRTWEGSALYGLELGNKFGLMASTDQHAGYPGSYGDGRIGVLAKSLNRDDIWEALRSRRLYAATGDKIQIDFRINNAIMGEVTRGNTRNIYLCVEGQNYIDYVDIVKNGNSIARMSAPLMPVVPDASVIRAKVKIDFGWNREEKPVRWDGFVAISEGAIAEVTPLFRGAAYTSPQEKNLKNDVDTHTTNVNRVLSKNDKRVDLEMFTTKNPNVLTPAMQGILLDVTMPKSGKITAKFNGKEFSYTLQELLDGTRAHFMNGWLSEAIQFNRACPESGFLIEQIMTDNKPERDTDYYYVRVRQRDGQWAWSSPIWVER
jgi:hypothetical protein